MTATNPEIGCKITAAGIITNYHDRGRGDPVLLIHGSGPGVTAWANWRLTMPALAERFRVLAPDVVGFGFSERPAHDRYDLDLWLGHMVGFLDTLGLAKVAVVGNSFGGALALALAVRKPERVERLVLMGAVGLDLPISPGLDAVWGYQPSVANMQRLIELFAYDRAGLPPDLAEIRYRASIRPGFQESFSAMFPPPRQNALRSLAQSDAAIRSIQCEALVVHGREDRVIPVENSWRLAHLIDRAQLHVFGRCGHWVQLEQSDRFNRLVGDFLHGRLR